MKFSYLENCYKQWNDILVIGKTIERNNKKYHIVGMTLADEAKLYVIEPYNGAENYSDKIKGVRNQRKLLKENRENDVKEDTYLHCSDFCLGNQWLRVQQGSSGSLRYSKENYEEIQLFLDMLRAGWIIPEWLKDEEWDTLQLVTLVFADVKKLPEYSPEMPIIIKHRPDSIRHILEKTITLNVGKSRSFSFVDTYGDKVQCFINNVTLIDVWKDTEEQLKQRLSDTKYTEQFSEEQLQEIKEHCYKALGQSCSRGTCYIGIEYECSKDINLQFYSKEFLKSVPVTHKGSSAFLMMNLKPDKKMGTHNLPLRGSVIQTAVSPDTVKIPAELFLYFEKVDAWEESV
ncbi:MAG: hypothetical protein J1E35_07500 [Lachnospiraceae bacterium]|nr:hypothetical protein [Lachnospiraceae bacterium]